MSQSVSSNIVDIEGELARLAAGTMRVHEMLDTSRRIMAVAEGSHWSQAAAYHAQAQFALGHLADGHKLIEQAWQLADRIDDPISGALAAQFAGACCARVYDYSQAEVWYRRELDRPRSRLAGSLRYSLIDLLASALVSQGDLAGARAVLGDYEGAAANHVLLAYFEGDWERGIMILRAQLEAARAEGRCFDATNAAVILGRIARVGNLRDEAQAHLNEALAGALRGPDLNRELFTRIELALLDADLGRIARAKEQLDRCQQILDNGEDWRGHKAAFAYASALVSAAEHIRKVTNSDQVWRVSLEKGGVLRLPEQVADGFRAAIEFFRRCQAPWEEAGALIFWSRVLFAASRHRQSAEKFNAAFAIFDRLATPLWCERTQAEIFRFLTLDSRPASITMGNGRGANVFRKEGDYWTISFEGSVFRLRDTMGMHYISRLLANPGTDLSVQDLAASAHKAKPKAGTRNKPEASMRDRRAGGDRDDYIDAARERARLMVTKRIKDVIAKIRRTHPELARHFAITLRTGYTCSYAGDDDHPGSWTT